MRYVEPDKLARMVEEADRLRLRPAAGLDALRVRQEADRARAIERLRGLLPPDDPLFRGAPNDRRS